MYKNDKKNSYSKMYFSDSHIDQLNKVIESDEIKCVSFDFFDTIVFRTCPQPANIFYLLGEKLIERNLIHSTCGPVLFHNLRIEAETKARNIIPNMVEINLKQIYEQFPKYLFTENNLLSAMQLELDIEYECIKIYVPILEIMQKAIESDKKVIVVSDTYFPSLFLKKILDKYIKLPDDSIFVSCEHKIGKSHGLFNLICKELKLKESKILHLGDNYDSDVLSPAKLGMRSYHLPNGTSLFWYIFDIEVQLKNSIFNLLNEYNGDESLTSLRARTLHHLDLVNSNDYMIYGSTIMGAVFAGFSGWVRQRSTELELTCNLCIMREGYFLNELLQNEKNLKTPTELVYLSRRVLIQSSWYEITSKSLSEIVGGREIPTLREFISLLCLTPNDILSFNNCIEKSLGEGDLQNEIIHFLINDKKLIRLILSRSKLLRGRMLKHFIGKLPSKIIENKDIVSYVGFVDIGWNGTIQKYLQRIFEKEEIKIKLVGLYLMTTPATQQLAMSDLIISGYLVDSGWPFEVYKWLIRSVEILEQICTPIMGSTIDFDHNGEAITAPYILGFEQSEQILAIQEGILNFQKIVQQHQLNIDWNKDSIKSYLRNIVMRAMVLPEEWEVNLFSNWEHDDNVVAQSAESLFSSAALPFINYMTVQQFLDVPMSELYWSFGAVKKECDHLSKQVKACISPTVNPNLFENNIQDFSVIYIHNGEFWIERPIQSNSPIYQNSQCLSYLKFESDQKKIKKLRIDISHRYSIIRIDMIRISGFIIGTKNKIEKIFTGSQLGLLSKITGMKQISISVYQTTPVSQIYIDLFNLGLGDLWKLKVELAFSIMDAIYSKEKNNFDHLYFSPLASDLPKFFPNKLVDNGIGKIDAINSINLDDNDGIVSIKQGDNVIIKGWCIDEDKRASSICYLRITNNSGGEEYYILTERSERQDVCDAFKSSSALMSGIYISFETNLLPIGNYRLALLQIFESNTILLRSKITMSIISSDFFLT